MIGFTSHTSNMIRTAGVRHRVIPASTFPTQRMARTGAESITSKVWRTRRQGFHHVRFERAAVRDMGRREYLGAHLVRRRRKPLASIQNPGNVGFGVLGAVVGTFGASSVYLTWWA